MPRTREQFLEMKDARMEAILSAALPLFSTNIAKVTIDTICEKAKCSHGIIYHYFKNTDEIYAKLLANPSYVDLKKTILSINEGSSYEQIESVITYLIKFEKNDIKKICYLNILIKDKEKDSVFDFLTKLIKKGQNSGTIIGGETKEIVNCIFLLLKGVYTSLILEKHPDIKVPSVENLMQLIRKPISF